MKDNFYSSRGDHMKTNEYFALLNIFPVNGNNFSLLMFTLSTMLLLNVRVKSGKGPNLQDIVLLSDKNHIFSAARGFQEKLDVKMVLSFLNYSKSRWEELYL